MVYTIPGVGDMEIRTIVLDLNGTLSVHGNIVEWVPERLKKLRELGFEIVLFTGDQRWNAQELCDELGIGFKKANSLEDKEKYFLEYDPETTVAIGNARIDIGKFRHAKLSIATLQSEWIHTGILEYVDIIVPNICDALDLFLDSDGLIATLRI